jgi:hypothetical protein
MNDDFEPMKVSNCNINHGYLIDQHSKNNKYELVLTVCNRSITNGCGT